MPADKRPVLPLHAHGARIHLDDRTKTYLVRLPRLGLGFDLVSPAFVASSLFIAGVCVALLTIDIVQYAHGRPRVFPAHVLLFLAGGPLGALFALACVTVQRIYSVPPS